MTLPTVKNWFNFSQKSFHVVFVDLKKAANGKIQCVEKPLNEPNLKYVALSYRWGELEEMAIDTNVGYTAIIKSFHLDDFYQLCRMMTKETDLQHMDYVWVDAICVDQTNYERRKATIYEMSNIYEHADYILAVPDLHARYLKTTSTMYKSAMEGSVKYQTDLYHLLHGIVLAKEAFDSLLVAIRHANSKVTGDFHLRKAVESYANTCTEDFSTQRILDKQFCKIFQNLLDDDQTEDATLSAQNRMEGDDVLIKQLYLGHESKTNIQEKRTAIQQSMEFFEDLIKDWSTRVWVISEFNVAKKNDNLKYWFTQLAPDQNNDHLDCGRKEFSFFKFESSGYARDLFTLLNGLYTDLIFKFYTTMVTQLQNQSLFEMLLKSKASRHEDRFYAILPLTKYKDKITNKAMVNSWKIDTLIAVKLKLYEIMDSNDKLNLLFSSGALRSTLSDALPSFATSTLYWGSSTICFSWDGRKTTDNWMGFNIGNHFQDDPIILYQCKISGLYYLKFCPKEYYVYKKYILSKDDANIIFKTNRALRALYSKDSCDANTLVRIPNYYNDYMVLQDKLKAKYSSDSYKPYHLNFIYLIGSFEKNMWVLTHYIEYPDERNWKLSAIPSDFQGFNIY